jgi:SAM-dependent methyltransferase
VGGLSEKALNYEHLALIYDAIMGDPEGITRYAQMLNDVLNKGRILDLACGTGDLTITLNDMGYQMTGLDLSNPMLKVAKTKADDRIRFIQGDMLNFDLYEVFDGIVCANDSVNYCSSLEEMAKLFENVNRHLAIHGIFVFDYHQIRRLDEFKDAFDEEGLVNDVGYWWHIESEPPKLSHTITIYANGYPVVEKHDQYIFELDEIGKLLHEKGFTIELIDSSAYDDLYTDEKWMIKAVKEREL